MGKQEALKRFAVDLTERARKGELDPVAGAAQQRPVPAGVGRLEQLGQVGQLDPQVARRGQRFTAVQAGALVLALMVGSAKPSFAERADVASLAPSGEK